MGSEPTGKRRIVFWILMLVLQVCVLEVLLSVYFFQRRSEHRSAIVHYVYYGYDRLTNVGATEALGIYQDDDRFGYRHRPNARGNHRTRSFDVTYAIGSDGERPIPPASSPIGRILFLGSSFTFGFGVGEREAYPYLLATEHWQNWELVNKAVSGWGTAHAYMLLLSELEGSRPPTIAIYNTIPDHVCRNYLRPAWLGMLARSQRGHPHFELVGGQPVFQRVATLKNAVPDEAVLRAKEVALTAAFITGMHEMAKRRNVRFLVVLLPQRFEVACGPGGWPPALARSLVENGVELLDLSELKPRMTWLEHDAHPDAGGHRVLAGAIAGSSFGDSLRARRP